MFNDILLPQDDDARKCAADRDDLMRTVKAAMSDGPNVFIRAGVVLPFRKVATPPPPNRPAPARPVQQPLRPAAIGKLENAVDKRAVQAPTPYGEMLLAALAKR